MLIMSAGWPGYGGNVRRKKKQAAFFFLFCFRGFRQQVVRGSLCGPVGSPLFFPFFSLCSAQLLVREQDLPHGECSGNSSRRSRDGNAWCKVLLLQEEIRGAGAYIILYCTVLYVCRHARYEFSGRGEVVVVVSGRISSSTLQFGWITYTVWGCWVWSGLPSVSRLPGPPPPPSRLSSLF